MKISLFPNAYGTQPSPWETGWAEFARDLGPHEFVDGSDEETKYLCRAFCPAEFSPGTERAKGNVVQLHLFVIDADKKTDWQAEALVDLIERQKLAAVVYTTFNHGSPKKPGWCLRVVVPLSRPVAAGDWDLFWHRANAFFGGVADAKCKDTPHIYFFPSAPRGTEDRHVYGVFEGSPLDVDRILVEESSIGAQPTSLERLSLERFTHFAKTLAAKRGDTYRAELGRLLVKVAKGEEFAEFGERDNTAFKLAQVLGEGFPDHDTQSIARHFAASLHNMGGSDPFPVERVEEKIRRAQERALAERAARAHEEQSRVKEAWGNCRETPYTQQEIASFGPNINRRWIIQRGTSYYFFFNGTYRGPYVAEEMQNKAIVDLAPARSAGVELFKLSKQGDVVQKTINQLVQQYGTVADDVVLDLKAQKTSFDEEKRKLIEAPCPLRPIQPTYREDVAKWLELLAGGKHEQLKTWLAAVTRLDSPCVALFLTGKKDTGKSLLALGVSRLWSTDKFTTLEEAFAAFNDPLARCPLCFADEQLPKDGRGFSRTAELRAHIQDTRRPYKRKFHPNSTLLGATRTIIAANNDDILQTSEGLSLNDIEAIIDRYLHVPVSDEAADYLATVDTYGAGWVDKDRIAEHVLWLVDNHPWEPAGRFLIRIEDQSLFRSLMTRSGPRAAICQWLVGYLLRPEAFHTRANSELYVRVKGKQLLMNVRGLLNCWDVYVDKKREPCPTAGELIAALKGLYDGPQRVALPNSDKKDRVFYRAVKLDNLVEWAENADFADRKMLERSLETDTEKLIPKLDTSK